MVVAASWCGAASLQHNLEDEMNVANILKSWRKTDAVCRRLMKEDHDLEHPAKTTHTQIKEQWCSAVAEFFE